MWRCGGFVGSLCGVSFLPVIPVQSTAAGRLTDQPTAPDGLCLGQVSASGLLFPRRETEPAVLVGMWFLRNQTRQGRG